VFIIMGQDRNEWVAFLKQMGGSRQETSAKMEEPVGESSVDEKQHEKNTS